MSRKLPPLLVLLTATVLSGYSGRMRLGGTMCAEAQIARPQFTAASLKGTCGFNAVATNVVYHSPDFRHPHSSFGTIAFDGIGSVTGTVTINASGKLIAPSTVTGTYTVNADGRTGTMDFSAHGGSIYSFVIVRGGTAIRYINTGPVDAKTGIVDVVTVATCKF